MKAQIFRLRNLKITLRKNRSSLTGGRARRQIKPVVQSSISPHVPANLKHLYHQFLEQSHNDSVLKYVNTDQEQSVKNVSKQLGITWRNLGYPKLKIFQTKKQIGQLDLNAEISAVTPNSKLINFKSLSPRRDGKHLSYASSIDERENDSILTFKNYLNTRRNNAPMFDQQLDRPSIVPKHIQERIPVKRRSVKDSMMRLQAYADSEAKYSQDVINEMKLYKIAHVPKDVLDNGIQYFKSNMKKLHISARPKLYKMNGDDVLEEFKHFIS